MRRIALSPIRLAKDDAVGDDEHWTLAVCSKNDQVYPFFKQKFLGEGSNLQELQKLSN